MKLSLLAIASANAAAIDLKEKVQVPKVGNPHSLLRVGVSIISCSMLSTFDGQFVRFGRAVLLAAMS